MCHAELKKDPGIPNLFPFKEQLLQQMQARKERVEGEKERQRLQRKQEHAKKRRSLQGMQNDAQKKTREFEKKVRLGRTAVVEGEREGGHGERREYRKESTSSV